MQGMICGGKSEANAPGNIGIRVEADFASFHLHGNSPDAVHGYPSVWMGAMIAPCENPAFFYAPNPMKHIAFAMRITKEHYISPEGSAFQGKDGDIIPTHADEGIHAVSADEDTHGQIHIFTREIMPLGNGEVDAWMNYRFDESHLLE